MSRTQIPAGMRRWGRGSLAASSSTGAWSLPGSRRVRAKRERLPKRTVATAACSQRSMPTCAATEPRKPPHTAPMDHQPWNELRMVRPNSRCTRSPCAFIEMSVRASMAAMKASEAEKTTSVGALATRLSPAIPTSCVTAATEADE